MKIKRSYSPEFKMRQVYNNARLDKILTFTCYFNIQVRPKEMLVRLISQNASHFITNVVIKNVCHKLAVTILSEFRTIFYFL